MHNGLAPAHTGKILSCRLMLCMLRARPRTRAAHAGDLVKEGLVPAHAGTLRLANFSTNRAPHITALTSQKTAAESIKGFGTDMQIHANTEAFTLCPNGKKRTPRRHHTEVTLWNT